MPDSLTPILYRVPTRPVTKRFVLIEETETDGDVVWKGPFAVGDERLRQAFDTVEGLMAEAGIPRGPIQRVRGMRPLSFAAEATGHHATAARDRAGAVEPGASRFRPSSGPRRRAADGVKILVHQAGRVEVHSRRPRPPPGCGRCAPGAPSS